MGKKRSLLKNDSHRALIRGNILAFLPYRLAIQDNAAGIRSFKASYQPQGGGLAAAAGAQESQYLSKGDGKVEFPHCRNFTEALGQAMAFQRHWGWFQPRIRHF